MLPSQALRMFRPTGRMMKAAGQPAGSPSFMSKVKKVPAELWPLAAVVGVAVVGAGFSLSRKLWVDKTMRLKRQNRAAEQHDSHEEHH
ncbi:uncharacterized protein DNG_08451 [Cephalotrichum gorgonifer]|uniref:Uncharacterized protein n=1 Tax=Cephalotrichum gorgonifer TaxID=2041049 RepID=A0AAE8N554_9PEZI|nr:uncharacterized protein DNG_08451 [Cephalotrichum gorgonifer]